MIEYVKTEKLIYATKVIEIKGLTNSRWTLGYEITINPAHIASIEEVVFETVKTPCCKVNIYGVETVINMSYHDVEELMKKSI